jgi:hypothetical protein
MVALVIAILNLFQNLSSLFYIPSGFKVPVKQITKQEQYRQKNHNMLNPCNVLSYNLQAVPSRVTCHDHERNSEY